jgi:hypothetical protein
MTKLGIFLRYMLRHFGHLSISSHCIRLFQRIWLPKESATVVKKQVAVPFEQALVNQNAYFRRKVQD